MISTKSFKIKLLIILECVVFINTEVNVKSLVKASIQAVEASAESVNESKYRGSSADDAYRGTQSVLYCRLSKTFPNIRIISKFTINDTEFQCENEDKLDTSAPPEGHRIVEYGNDRIVDDEQITIWIEPLDGSAGYSDEGLNERMTISVCIAIDGVPEVGVINKPSIDRTTWAWNNVKRSTDLLELVKRDVEFKPRIETIQDSNLKKVTRLARLKHGNKVKEAAEGALVAGILDVATLKSEVLIATGAIEKWKTCAGSAIVRSLGGKASDLVGSLIDYSSTSDVVNRRGLLVTATNHKSYVKTFKSLASN